MVLVGAAASACTVDLGAPPDAAPCTPAPDRFVSSVWPDYLVANQCAARGCHDFSSGHGTLRLRAPEAELPAPGTPLDAWPFAWRENFLSSIQHVRCDAPDESRLLTVPEGVGDRHPPGPVVRDRARALAIVRAWVAP